MLDELNITPEMVQEAKTIYAADLAADALKRAADKEAAEEHFRQFQENLALEDQEFEVDWKKVAVLLGGAIMVVGGTIVVVEYGPAIKRKWQEKVTPHLDAAIRKVSRRPAEPED